MKTNEQLQKDVQDAIKWEPLLNAAEIGVIAKDGVVTLTGVVDSYLKKAEAETAAKSVAGVRAVAETIDINFGGTRKKNDTEIANDIVSALRGNSAIPYEKVKVEVENGYVTLEGNVEWHFQRDAAKKTVVNIAGIVSIRNNITIKSDAVDAVEKAGIERALERNSSMGDNEIHVAVTGNKVTLTGMVNSLYEKDAAERTAWNAPGVCTINNNLFVGYDD
jgi:osmotically-inducible protein OsmY